MLERRLRLNTNMKKYKSLVSAIKDVYSGSDKGNYRSLISSIFEVLAPGKLEKGIKNEPEQFTTGLKNAPITNVVEVDPSDQITAGGYRTKHFEMNPQAQFLFANLPKDPRLDHDALENLAVNMDLLFGIHKDAAAGGYATDEELSLANDISKKIFFLARNLNLHKSVDFINDTLRLLTDLNKQSQGREPGIRKTHSNVFTKEKPDKDVDTSQFAISRANRSQRKLKIIDDD